MKKSSKSSKSGESRAEFLSMKQGSAEWHEHRNKFKNASEAPVIMGESKYMTRRQLAEIKFGIRAPSETNAAMAHGKHYEPIARKLYNNKSGESFVPYVVTRGEFSASLDGLSEDRKRAIEIKCPTSGCSSPKWISVALGFMPEDDYWQVQHQIYTSYVTVCIYIIYCWKHKHYICLSQTKDEDKTNKLIDAWDNFWKMIKSGVLPELCDKDVLDRDDEEWTAEASCYISAKDSIDELSEDLEKSRKNLIKLSGGFSCRGGGITVKAHKKGKSYSYKIYKDKK